MRGVIQRTYDTYRKSKGLKSQPVKQIADAELQEIYRTQYWDAVKGDSLADGVDLATFDYGVNSGPSRARAALLASVGADDVSTIKKVCSKRLGFLKGLGTFKTFGKGWSNRVADIEARGVKMALQAKGLSDSQVKAKLVEEASSAAKASAANAGGGTGSGVTAAGSIAHAANSLDLTSYSSMAVIAIAVIAIGAAIFFTIRSRHNKARADAYTAIAGA